MKKLRIGMIGAGNIAKTHLVSYSRNAYAEVVAICDINEATLNETADEYGIEKRFTSVDEMLKSVELDAADVCVWNCAHASCSIAALNAGLNVMCEKPMAMNAKEAQAMADAAKANNKLLMIGFVTRFSTQAQIAKDFIDNGELGEIYYAKASYIRRHGNPGGWFSDKARSGGGCVVDIGVHPLDLTRYLMGNPKPVSVSAFVTDRVRDEHKSLKTNVGWTPRGANPLTDTNDVEAAGTALITYEDGKATLLECSYDIHMDASFDSTGRTIFGTKGAFNLDKMMFYTDHNGFLVNTEIKDADLYKGSKDLFQNEIDHFVDCCMNGTECRAKAEDGVVVMKILDAIYESARIGKSVEIK